MKLRIAAYAVALNESQFVKKWADSARDADYLLVADTGSKDDTVKLCEQNGVNVVNIKIKPWRFDDARNASMAMLPSDLDAIIALDMDEVLVPGWRKLMEDNWNEGCTRFRYKYVWSWQREGVPGLIYYGDKITARHSHRWKHPVHEVMSPTTPEVMCWLHDFLIHHHPDNSKPRSQYLPLLEMAVQESPEDDRNAHYLGREYYFQGRYDDSIKELTRHLALPRALWKAERAASMRLIAKCHESQGHIQDATHWYINATLEDPNSREALTDAATFALKQNSFYAVLDYCDKALKLSADGGNYLNERYAMAEGPYDLASVAHFNLGNKAKAMELAEQAVALNPYDERLLKNLEMLKA